MFISVIFIGLIIIFSGLIMIEYKKYRHRMQVLRDQYTASQEAIAKYDAQPNHSMATVKRQLRQLKMAELKRDIKKQEESRAQINRDAP
ncbi:MAG: hypothetical protein ACO3K7_03600 [Candidatus Marinamargulisbacteria bacterium]